LNPNGDYKMDDLLREAIADAKAVRETALANAKIALEEAFTPRLQSMLSKKIAAESEIEDDEDLGEDEHEAEEGDDFEEMSHDAEEMSHDAEETDHEETDHEEGDHEEGEMRRDDVEEADQEETDSEEGEERNEGEEREEDDSVEEADDAEEDDSVEEADDAEDEDDLDLESVLAELEKDLDDEDHFEEAEDKDEEDKVDESEESDKDEEDKVDENDVSSDIGKADNKVNPEANDSSKTGAQGPEGEGSDKKSGDELGDHETVDDLTEDLDLDEVLKALTEEEEEEDKDAELESLQKEIKEYRKVINFMRKNLNEVNLLNAKLLFSNKLFRAFGLNNNQKLKVVETFDRTTNLREVKLVYATLAESFKKPTSKIVESKGSSSKAVRSTKPAKQEVLSEGAELRNRFKKLANIL
jgi:hypothetical protein